RERPHHLPFPRARPEPRHGVRSESEERAIPGAHRRASARSGPRRRYRRGRQRHGRRAEVVPVDPSAGDHLGPALRDRVPRPRRRGFRVHVRLRSAPLRKTAVLIFLGFLAPVLRGAEDAATGPCPAHLFVIERSKNANIVVYDARLAKGGELAKSKPVVAYWLLDGDKDRRDSLHT